MFPDIMGYINETSAPSIGVAGGIIGGTILANVVIEKYLNITGSKAMYAKMAVKLATGAYLYRSAIGAVTTGQLIKKSAGIGILSGIVLDFAKQYGFAKALESALVGRQYEYPTKSEYWKDFQGKEVPAPIGPFNAKTSPGVASPGAIGTTGQHVEVVA